MNLFLKDGKKINPMVGAGISAFPCRLSYSEDGIERGQPEPPTAGGANVAADCIAVAGESYCPVKQLL